MATIFRLEDFSWWGNNSFSHLGWFEGVLCRENNVYQESSLEKTNKPQFASDKIGCGRFFGIMTLLYGAESGTNKPCHTNRLDSSTYTKSDLKPKPIPKRTCLDYLDVSEGFASRLPQVSKLLLQSPGGRHSPLQQCPTLWKPKFERINKLSTLKSSWGQYPKRLPEYKHQALSSALGMMSKYGHIVQVRLQINQCGAIFRQLGENQQPSWFKISRWANKKAPGK